VNRRTFLRYGAYGLAATALSPRPGATRAGAGIDLGTVTRAVIHPAIGIARVGNSPSEWFLGPEVPGPHPVPPDGFKDAEGRLKRQAARFRLYGLDDAGQVVGELTAEQAEIAWTVHLANAKAAWYTFDLAFDIPTAMGERPAPSQPAPPPTRSVRRNRSIDDRSQLVVDPGPRTIQGRGVNGDGRDPGSAFDGGRFLGTEVPLGDLRTDEAGRLLVFGGFGTSAPAVPGLRASTFANNDLWHDDVSDGPVDAAVRLDGRDVPVTGAWVVVAPPNYAPGIQSVVTMYDVLFEVATRLEPERRPPRPSFTRQIYPLFERIVQNQWVNAGFLRDFGWGSPGDFLAPATLAALADPSDGARALRWQVFERFRDPAFLSMESSALPGYYGDDMRRPATNPRQWMAVLEIQHEWLRQWADGDFEADWPDGGPTFAADLGDLPLSEQPVALDRAALDECLGGPFHPGCEMTWPMRRDSLYEAPFRLRRRTEPEPDWGDVMTSEIALADDGPLGASGPGDVSRWMAVPWQTDTASCLSAYKDEIDEYLPTFWPARVPNDVLAQESYLATVDPALPPEERQEAFATRVKWLRDLPDSRGSSVPRINAFIQQWGQAGVVTRHPGPADGAAFPETFWVELGHALTEDDAEDDEAGAAPPPAATPEASG
jgi:hypothetical protein